MDKLAWVMAFSLDGFPQRIADFVEFIQLPYPPVCVIGMPESLIGMNQNHRSA
jgi:hypothetical protein